MNASPTTGSAPDIADWFGAVNTGAGVLTVMLFPFAIPILLLTIAFTAPFLIVAVLALVPIGIVAGIVLAIRRLGRYARGLGA
jgi:hypothetical protein